MIGGDLEVNRLGFGAMRLCGPGIWGEPDDPRGAEAVLRRAVELGINFIDTSDAYGPEVNERQISTALNPYDENLVVATKGGLTRPSRDEWIPDGRPGHLREACEGSLRAARRRPHRPLPAARARPRGRLRGHGLGAGATQGRGQDPACRPLQRRGQGDGDGHGHRSYRLGPEPLQPRRPLLGGTAAGVRAGGRGLYPLVPAGDRQPVPEAGGRSTRSPIATTRLPRRWPWPGSWRTPR